MALLIGTATATLDEKNRLTIPKKFREPMGIVAEQPCEVWFSRDTALGLFRIMTREEGERHFNQILNESHNYDSDAELLFERTERVEVDRAGRALIPAEFLQQCGISSRAMVLAGRGRYVAAYTEESWKARESKITAETLANFEAEQKVQARRREGRAEASVRTS